MRMNCKCRLSIFFLCLIVTASLAVNSCRKNPTGSNVRTTPMNFIVPEGFPPPVYDFENNPVTEEGFALGKKLFRDNRLSLKADVTCSSCHQQEAAFTTFDHDLGHGTNHQHTTRNVPAIFNMAWHSEFQWDGSVSNLVDQPLTCLTAPEKMGEEVNSVINKLSGDAEYKKMFAESFGDENITGERISRAIAQFVVMLVSADSKYDKAKKGEAVFNSSEQNGYEIFTSKCTGCHSEPLFTDLSYRNNGLPLNPNYNDGGRIRVTGNASDSLKFKVPSLRNVGITGYFAHDGRFPAFTQMINHYNEGIEHNATLDPLLASNIPLTDLEKFYLQEFLHTLSDSSLISDPRFE